MDVKLIAFDLDGTLLDDEKRLPPENLRALKAAAERGIVCVPATGRMMPVIPEALREQEFIRYYISVNGAYVYDTALDRELYRAELPAETAEEIFRLMDTLPVIYDCYRGNLGLMERRHYEAAAEFFHGMPHVLDMVRRSRRPVDGLKELIQADAEPLQKVQMFFRPEDGELRRRLLEDLPRQFPGLKISSSISNNIEINSAGADKGLALEALADHLGVPMGQTLAFGDGSNDIALLRAAGLGVAMANAVPELISAADAVAGSNNEGGVGKMIMRLLCGENP